MSFAEAATTWILFQLDYLVVRGAPAVKNIGIIFFIVGSNMAVVRRGVRTLIGTVIFVMASHFGKCILLS